MALQKVQKLILSLRPNLDKNPTFVVRRRIEVKAQWQFNFLDTKMKIANKLYNTAAKYYIHVIENFRSDARYVKIQSDLKKTKDQKERAAIYKKLNELLTEYELSEYSVKARVNNHRKRSFGDGFNSTVSQQVGKALWASMKKAIYKGTEIHYRKKGQTCSFESNAPKDGISYRSKDDTILIMGQRFSLTPIRKKDAWTKKAMLYKIKYCRVKREIFGTKYRYFLELVMAGVAPAKETFEIGNGIGGVDQGTSTVAYDTEEKSDFVVLGNGFEKYAKDILKYSVEYERRRRLANPQCYNEDGTIIKGAKFTNHTSNMMDSLFKLKNAYRLKSTFIKSEHNQLAKEILKHCDVIVKEPMDFSKLKKRSSKPTERQDKVSIVKTKDGNSKRIQKFKRKKRFGKSCQDRSPGLFQQILLNKAKQFGVAVIEINLSTYKASQYNHITKKTTKPLLSDRVKQIGEHIVQRDLYSAFLLRNLFDETKINFKKCNLDFERFIRNQEKVIQKVESEGDITKNFGLKYFEKR